MQEQITPANDNRPAAPSLQRKPWESQEAFRQRIKAASERTQQPEKETKRDPAERMKPKPWETAAEFEKRKQAMRDREKQPLNLDLKPEGPTRSY